MPEERADVKSAIIYCVDVGNYIKMGVMPGAMIEVVHQYDSRRLA